MRTPRIITQEKLSKNNSRSQLPSMRSCLRLMDSIPRRIWYRAICSLPYPRFIFADYHMICSLTPLLSSLNSLFQSCKNTITHLSRIHEITHDTLPTTDAVLFWREVSVEVGSCMEDILEAVGQNSDDVIALRMHVSLLHFSSHLRLSNNRSRDLLEYKDFFVQRGYGEQSYTLNVLDNKLKKLFISKGGRV